MKPRKAHDIAKTGRDASASLYSVSYVAQYITTVLGLFITSAAEVFKAIGSVFPPIAYVFDGFKALFNIGIEYYKRKNTKPEEDEVVASVAVPLVKTPEATSDSGIRIAANVTVVILDILVVAALAGALFSNPIGWAIAAFATLVGWIADDVVPAWRAREENKSCQLKISELNKKLHQSTSLVDKLEIKEEIRECQVAANNANKSYIEARNKALVGLVAVIGMAFFACGPFGFAALGLIGSAIFVGLAVKGIGGALYNKWISRKTHAINESAAVTTKLSTAAIKSKLPVNKEITRKRKKVIDSQTLQETTQPKTSIVTFGQLSPEEETLKGGIHGRRKTR